jgi:hypothetical protein
MGCGKLMVNVVQERDLQMQAQNKTSNELQP